MKTYNWNPDKNQHLIETRGASFENVVFHLQNGGFLDDMKHPNATDYPLQRMFVVNMNNYAYLVPYIETDDEVFLKTIIPSRKATKHYLGESTWRKQD